AMLDALGPPCLTANVGRSSIMQCNLESVQTTLAKMAADGWDTNAPLKWGFFFAHSSKEPLLKVVTELKDHEYHVESIHQSEDETWVLQVSKTEVLAAEKLHRRNIAFNELAAH